MIPNGHWANFARQRGCTVNGTANKLEIDRSSLVRFLNGDSARLGKEKQRLLRKLWRVSKTRMEAEREKALESRRNGDRK